VKVITLFAVYHDIYYTPVTNIVFRERPIRVKRPMSDVPIFRR